MKKFIGSEAAEEIWGLLDANNVGKLEDLRKCGRVCVALEITDETTMGELAQKFFDTVGDKFAVYTKDGELVFSPIRNNAVSFEMLVDAFAKFGEQGKKDGVMFFDILKELDGVSMGDWLECCQQFKDDGILEKVDAGKYRLVTA